MRHDHILKSLHLAVITKFRIDHMSPRYSCFKATHFNFACMLSGTNDSAILGLFNNIFRWLYKGYSSMLPGTLICENFGTKVKISGYCRKVLLVFKIFTSILSHLFHYFDPFFRLSQTWRISSLSTSNTRRLLLRRTMKNMKRTAMNINISLILTFSIQQP